VALRPARSGGCVFTASIGILEAILAMRILVRRAGVLTYFLVIGLAAIGVLLALAGVKRCGCLGDVPLDRTQHLLLACVTGTLGSLMMGMSATGSKLPGSRVRAHQ
jgi:hypothetical protein